MIQRKSTLHDEQYHSTQRTQPRQRKGGRGTETTEAAVVRAAFQPAELPEARVATLGWDIRWRLHGAP